MFCCFCFFEQHFVAKQSFAHAGLSIHLTCFFLIWIHHFDPLKPCRLFWTWLCSVWGVYGNHWLSILVNILVWTWAVNLLACRWETPILYWTWTLFCNLKIQMMNLNLSTSFPTISNPHFSWRLGTFFFFWKPSRRSPPGLGTPGRDVREFDAQGLTNLTQSLAKLEMASKDVMLDALIQASIGSKIFQCVSNDALVTVGKELAYLNLLSWNFWIWKKHPGFWQKTRWWQLNYVLFSPRSLEKMNPFWRAYSSNGLKSPTRKHTNTPWLLRNIEERGWLCFCTPIFKWECYNGIEGIMLLPILGLFRVDYTTH